jgi:hypothetical protein
MPLFRPPLTTSRALPVTPLTCAELPCVPIDRGRPRLITADRGQPRSSLIYVTPEFA